MTVKEFLENCDVLGLKLGLKAGAISITGEREFIEDAHYELKHSKELTAGVIELLRERAAKEQAQAEPQAQEQERQAEPVIKVNWLLPQDARAACTKVLQGLTDATRAKLKNFIMACRRRGINIYYDTTSSGGQRVFLEPVTGDISDLFTWIHGFSECMLLIYLSSQNNYLAYNLDVIAQRFNCDLFTAAYLATGIKRDLYIATCADWNFKPEHIPPELEERIKFKPVPSNTKLRIFEVENKHGEIFKFQTSCIDEVLPDALKGLRVIQELTPTADASLITGNKSD